MTMTRPRANTLKKVEWISKRTEQQLTMKKSKMQRMLLTNVAIQQLKILMKSFLMANNFRRAVL
jgi:hypothetical protein